MAGGWRGGVGVERIAGGRAIGVEAAAVVKPEAEAVVKEVVAVGAAAGARAVWVVVAAAV